MRKSLVLLLSLGLLGLATGAPAQAGDIRSERVQFPKGKTGTTIKGRIRRDQIVDYKLRARAGQRMIVKLETDNSSNFGVCSSATFLFVNQGNNNGQLNNYRRRYRHPGSAAAHCHSRTHFPLAVEQHHARWCSASRNWPSGRP
jgi:hypothetical protein